MPLEVKHQSGNKKSGGVKESYSSNISVEVKEFYDSPYDVMAGTYIYFKSKNKNNSSLENLETEIQNWFN